ncbi:MAG: RNA polymerase sigma factor [Phycisphaerae bacterium]
MSGPRVETEYWRLLEPWLARAAGYARSILRDRHAAEDAVQQAALRGFERFADFDAARPFKGWWFAILRNCCLDALRRSRVRAAIPLDGHEPAAPVGPAPEWEALADGMERLSPEHREILRLRYFGELSYRELAEALAIPPGTVMSRLHLARHSLAEQLRKEER